VILPKSFAHPLIYDSKALSLAQRNEAEALIRTHALAYAIAEISPQEIDQINILQASIKAMHHAVDALTIQPELLVVDGNRFNPYPFIPHQTAIKGDSKIISIAAASILAKGYRDRLMVSLHEAHPQYGWLTNVGYPSIKHRNAITLHGATVHHRLTFRGVK
jgi:ribonuclease HII